MAGRATGTRIASIELQGYEPVVASLQRMGREGVKILKKAMREAFKITLKESIRRAPVRSGKGGGSLKKSIRLRSMRTRRGQFGFRIVTLHKYLPAHSLRTSGFYPAHQELGYTDKGGTYHAGKAYMRGALYDTRQQVIKRTGWLIFQGLTGTIKRTRSQR